MATEKKKAENKEDEEYVTLCGGIARYYGWRDGDLTKQKPKEKDSKKKTDKKSK